MISGVVSFFMSSIGSRIRMYCIYIRHGCIIMLMREGSG